MKVPYYGLPMLPPWILMCHCLEIVIGEFCMNYVIVCVCVYVCVYIRMYVGTCIYLGLCVVCSKSVFLKLGLSLMLKVQVSWNISLKCALFGDTVNSKVLILKKMCSIYCMIKCEDSAFLGHQLQVISYNKIKYYQRSLKKLSWTFLLIFKLYLSESLNRQKYNY